MKDENQNRLPMLEFKLHLYDMTFFTLQNRRLKIVKIKLLLIGKDVWPESCQTE